MFDLVQDIRYALRSFKKNQGFVAIAILTLGLGIGVNATVFSIINAVLLRPLPYPHAGRLVFVRDIQGNVPGFAASIPEYLKWKESCKTYMELAAFWPTTANLSGEREPQRVKAVLATSSLLRILDVNPILGRNLNEDDQKPGISVAMISYELWRNRFGEDPSIVGKLVRVDSAPVRIVGVLPPGIRDHLPVYSSGQHNLDIWFPVKFSDSNLHSQDHYMTVIGLLNPGVSFQQARAETESISVHLQEEGQRHGVVAYNLREHAILWLRPMLLLLQVAVGMVLLIACANVANILFSRVTSRQREIAVRLALGAPRSRLVRQMLTESLLISLAGGGAGLFLASLCQGILQTAVRDWVPSGVWIGIDNGVLAFTLAVSLFSGILFGLLPTLQATSANVHGTLKEGGRQAGAGRRGNRLRHGLVVIEVSLSAILLIGAGLLIHSFLALSSVDLGFDPNHVLTTQIPLSGSKYDTPQKILNFYTEFLSRVKGLPGVSEAAITQVLPILGGWNSHDGIEGHSFAAGEKPLLEFREVSDGFFQTLKVPLLMGRTFQAQDRLDSTPVAVVNQEFVRRFFPNESPLGRKIYRGQAAFSIIGVVGNVKLAPDSSGYFPTYYMSYRQRMSRSMVLLVRSNGPGTSRLGRLIREQALQIDPDQPISELRSMNQVLASQFSRPAFLARLMLGFAVLALFLAAVGIYGVISYAVNQQTQEIGIRMALGADYGKIQKFVLGHGLLLALGGLAIGVLAALPLSRLISSQLYGVTTYDPIVYGGVVLILFLISLMACIIPAHRAARVDPLLALRCE